MARVGILGVGEMLHQTDRYTHTHTCNQMEWHSWEGGITALLAHPPPLTLSPPHTFQGPQLSSCKTFWLLATCVSAEVALEVGDF